MKKNILLLMLLIVPFTHGCATGYQQKVIKGKKIAIEKIQFILRDDMCGRLAPGLRICPVDTKINSQPTWLLVYDDSGEIGITLYCNTENNNIYVESIPEKAGGEIIYAGKMYRYHAKSKYYYISKAKIENGALKPLFLKGTQVTYRKRMRNFLDFFDYDYLYRVYINIPGILKPTFVSYCIRVDGRIKEVIRDQEVK